MLLRHMPSRRQNDHQLVATILSSTKHSEWGNDWSLFYYSALYYKILFKMRNNDHQLVATILSSTKHSEWGNDWSLFYYSALYYKILFKMRNMKRQLYPNSEYCNGNLIIIDFIHVIVS